MYKKKIGFYKFMEIFDKVKLVGEFDLNTPTIIIEEVADWLGLRFDRKLLNQPVYRARVLISIDKAHREDVDSTKFVPSQNLSKLAKFLNPDENLNWTKTKLLQGWTYIKKFLSGDISTNTFGYPIPDNPCKISSVILYHRISQLEKIEFNHNTSLEQLAECYESIRLEEDQLRTRIHFLLNRVTSRFDLLKILCHLDSVSKVDLAYSSSSDWNKHIPLLDPVVGAMITPTTREEAIKVSLKYYHRDISQSIDPLREFMHFKMRLPPFDPHMQLVERLNKNAYNIHHTFNPNIPEEYYEKGRLFSMGQTFDLEPSDSIFQELVSLSLIDNFYLGVQPGVTQFSSSIYFEDLTQFDEVPPLVCYGSASTSFKIYLFSELINMFNANIRFTNPDGGSFQEIPRLKKLVELSNPKSRRRRGIRRIPGSPTKVIVGTYDKLWDQLLETIDRVSSFQQENQKFCLELLHFYNSSDNFIKNDIKSTLDSIMIMAMHMRGWKDETEPWPVSVVPMSDHNITFSYVLPFIDMVIAKFQTEGGEYIGNLPLLYFENDEFFPSTSTEKGLTIKDRINIVNEGEDTNNINSCIRTSSNWFIFTAHRYLSVIGFKPYFSPGSVKIIG